MIYSKLTFNNILKKLKADGYRSSSVRNLIISHFFKKPHWFIDELYVSVKSQNESVTLQTVYNTVQLLLQKHILVSYNFDGKTTVYELFDPIAFHCYCEYQDKVIHINCSEELKTALFSAVEKHEIDCLHIQIKAIGKLKDNSLNQK